jgi:hypothetical protein
LEICHEVGSRAYDQRAILTSLIMDKILTVSMGVVWILKLDRKATIKKGRTEGMPRTEINNKE